MLKKRKTTSVTGEGGQCGESGGLSSLPGAGVIQHRRLGDLKQHKLIVYSSGD